MWYFKLSVGAEASEEREILNISEIEGKVDRGVYLFWKTGIWENFVCVWA